MPNGTITNADGGRLTLRPEQLLTFDGVLINREDAVVQPDVTPARPLPQ
jgi:hypothetical protein